MRVFRVFRFFRELGNWAMMILARIISMHTIFCRAWFRSRTHASKAGRPARDLKFQPFVGKHLLRIMDSLKSLFGALILLGLSTELLRSNVGVMQTFKWGFTGISEAVTRAF